MEMAKNTAKNTQDWPRTGKAGVLQNSNGRIDTLGTTDLSGF